MRPSLCWPDQLTYPVYHRWQTRASTKDRRLNCRPSLSWIRCIRQEWFAPFRDSWRVVQHLHRPSEYADEPPHILLSQLESYYDSTLSLYALWVWRRSRTKVWHDVPHATVRILSFVCVIMCRWHIETMRRESHDMQRRAFWSCWNFCTVKVEAFGNKARAA